MAFSVNRITKYQVTVTGEEMLSTSIPHYPVSPSFIEKVRHHEFVTIVNPESETQYRVKKSTTFRGGSEVKICELEGNANFLVLLPAKVEVVDSDKISQRFTFQKTIYPDDPVFLITSLPIEIRVPQGDTRKRFAETYGFRYVMPNYGPTLCEEIMQEANFIEIMKKVLGVLRAIKQVHDEYNIIHGDLNVDNVYWRDGELRMCDASFSQAIGSLIDDAMIPDQSKETLRRHPVYDNPKPSRSTLAEIDYHRFIQSFLRLDKIQNLFVEFTEYPVFFRLLSVYIRRVEYQTQPDINQLMDDLQKRIPEIRLAQSPRL